MQARKARARLTRMVTWRNTEQKAAASAYLLSVHTCSLPNLELVGGLVC